MCWETAQSTTAENGDNIFNNRLAFTYEQKVLRKYFLCGLDAHWKPPVRTIDFDPENLPQARVTQWPCVYFVFIYYLKLFETKLAIRSRRTIKNYQFNIPHGARLPLILHKFFHSVIRRVFLMSNLWDSFVWYSLLQQKFGPQKPWLTIGYAMYLCLYYKL